ncbi:Xaa-Pro dipeptidyl-peptidase [Micromonospora sp. NPDC094482]|uniref:Xaa-Pro dipeptidyl-peptidase n=1 Tax=unclassified Micromonospora TaxID=2617518 RepID=UPI0033189597
MSSLLRQHRGRAGKLASAVVLATVTFAVVPGTATAHPASAAPFVQADQTVPVYSYVNAIRESVYVDSPVSSGEGVNDRIAVDIIRPREAAAAGVKVPVIMVASPYYKSIGRGLESEIKTYDSTGTANGFPLYYDNYFVPRGYAIALVDVAGTNRSTGCNDISGPAEIGSAKAAIDWLNGRVGASAADGRRVVADWSTGKVGMIGKSWDGTIANGVAATGVDGLATIVPIAAISSWYDYMRFNGVLRGPDGVPWHHDFVTGRPDGVCDAMVAQMAANAGEDTGNYTDFWAQRDFTRQASNVRASVFAVHGLNDLNVTSSQFGDWWTALGARNVPRKVWLSQTGHVDPFDFRRTEWVNTLHQWFDFWLQGLDNGIMGQPAVSIERDPSQWVQERSWPPAGTRITALRLGNGDGTTGVLGAPQADTTIKTFTDVPTLNEVNAVGAPKTTRDGRLVFLTKPLTADLRFAGKPTVTLSVQVDRPTTTLTARLVDYGLAQRVDHMSTGEGIRVLTTESCFGESSPTDNGCYKETAQTVVNKDVSVLTRGWLDAAHYGSLRSNTPLQPGRWYMMTVPLQSYDAVLKPGHILGLVLTQSDLEQTYPTPTGATVRIDLTKSQLNLPIAAGSVPPAVGAPTDVPTTDNAVAPRAQGGSVTGWKSYH